MSAIARPIQIGITGGSGSPKVWPFIAARLRNQSGTWPNTLPAYSLPMLVRICVRPEMENPTPRVRINA